MKNILFLLMLFTTSIFAQNYTELFKNDLPKMVVKNTTYQSSFNYNLEKYWFSNPDLIYFYFQHLNQKFEQKNNDSKSNYFNFLWNNYNASVDSIESISQKRLLYSEESLSYGKKRNLILNYIEDQTEHSVGNVRKTNDFNLDSTYSNYLIYKLLTNNSELTFENEINYYSLCKASLLKTMDFFESTLGTFEQYSSEQLKDIASKARLFYLLFNDTQENKFNLKMNIGFTDFLSTILSDIYKKKFKLKFKLNTSVLPIIIDETDFHRDKYLFAFRTPYSIRIYSWPVVEVGLGLRIPLVELGIPFQGDIGFLSHIDLNFVGSTFFISSDKSDYSKKAVIRRSYYPGGKWFHGELQSNEYDIDGAYTLVGQIEAPIVYLGETTYLSAGVNFTFQDLGSFSIKKTQYQTGSTYYDESDIEMQSYDIIITDDFTITPLISLNSLLSKHWNFKIELAPFTRGVVGIEYLLDL